MRTVSVLFILLFIFLCIYSMQADGFASGPDVLFGFVFNEGGQSKALFTGYTTGLTGIASADLLIFETISTFALLSNGLCYSFSGGYSLKGLNGNPIVDCQSNNFAFNYYETNTCTGSFTEINNQNPEIEAGLFIRTGFCPGFQPFNEISVTNIQSMVYPFSEKGIEKQIVGNFNNGQKTCATTPIYTDIFTPNAILQFFFRSPCLTEMALLKKITPIGSADMVDCATGRIVGNFFNASCTGYSFPVNSVCLDIGSKDNVVFSGACQSSTPFLLTTTTTANNEDGGGGGCFPGSALVQLENGNLMRMDKLQIGDRIQIGDNRTSEVFLFSHNDAMAETDFVEIVVSRFSWNDDFEIKQNLRLTPGHLVYVYHDAKREINAVPARDIRIGQFLAIGIDMTTLYRSAIELPRVLHVSTVRDKGLYNPHTLDSILLVNGILVSSYTDAIPLPLAHALLAPARAMYEMGTFYANDF